MTVTCHAVADFVTDRTFGMLIDGELVNATGDATSTVFDPSTGQELAEVPEASRGDVDRAVHAARAAQPAWQKLGLRGWSACFARFGELLETHLEELAMLDAIGAGLPVRAMRDDVRITYQYLDGWPRLAAGIAGQALPLTPDTMHLTSHRPYGVVGKICAFNHPAMFAITRPLPALITGNTVVMKPAPQTPLSALRLAELFAQAFPPGVVNVVTGGVEAGDSLVTHPFVKRIGFTGSVPTGLTIQRRAAESGHVKHVSLELGGKNAMIVLPDVDVDAAVEGAVYGMNFTVCQGQSCGSVSRVLVHRSIYDDFVARAAAVVNAYKVTTAYDEAADMGPLVSRATTSASCSTSTRAPAREPSWSPGAIGRPTFPTPDGSSTRPCSPVSAPRCESHERRSSDRS